VSFSRGGFQLHGYSSSQDFLERPLLPQQRHELAIPLPGCFGGTGPSLKNKGRSEHMVHEDVRAKLLMR
jgi:hypothetical protein